MKLEKNSALLVIDIPVEHGNEPFGAVLAKDREIVFTNENQIYTKHDPTFHGELGLIRGSARRPASPTCTSTHCIPAANPVSCAAAQWYGSSWGGLVYGASRRAPTKI